MYFLLRRYLKSSYRYVRTRRLLKQFDEQMQLHLNQQKAHFCTIVINSEAKSFASNPNIKKYLNYLVERYRTGDKQLNISTLNLNLNSLSYLFNEYLEINEYIQNLKDLDEQDSELKKLVQEEEHTYKTRLEIIDEMMLAEILKRLDSDDYNSIILEIAAGVGGQEAMIFAKDLYDMYKGYANYLGLNYNVIDIDKTDIGGYRSVSILIKGTHAFQKLQYEGGVHRVQRIPQTERSGRVHTSTVSVAVMPEPSDVKIQLESKDLKIETKRASGAGGQHVNTTDSAVRITHLPTGIFVTCQSGRSQIKNKEIAMTKLRVLLYHHELNKQLASSSQLRKKQMGLGMRNEKIRTYNYPQRRVTDHRLESGTVYNIKEFMEGREMLEALEDRLRRDMQQKLLLEIITELKLR